MDRGNTKKRPNVIPMIVAAICLVFVICGGFIFGMSTQKTSDTVHYDDSDTDLTARTVDHAIGEEQSAVSGDHYDLTADGPIAISGTAEREDIYIFPQRLYTNSCAISVQNNTDSTIMVYLYNSTRLSDPIQQFTLSGHDTAQFTNLTSQYLYHVGVGPGTEQDIQLTISQ